MTYIGPGTQRLFRAGVDGGPSSILTGLIAYYKLSDTADSSGNGYTLTQVGTNTFAAGKIGNALSCDGSAGKYLKSTDLVFNFGNVDFTIWGWINPGALSGFPGFITRWGDATHKQYSLQLDGSSKFQFTASYDGSNNPSVTATTPALSTSTWYLVVCWHDSVNHLLGIQVNNGTIYTAAMNAAGVFQAGASAELEIGARNTIGAPTALIDEVGIENRLLTTTEKTSLYNGGAGVTWPF